MQSERVKQLIESNLANSVAVISGDDDRHFSAVIISTEFLGKNLVQRQQMVYAILNHEITSGIIHAITLKTYTPEEWQALQGHA